MLVCIVLHSQEFPEGRKLNLKSARISSSQTVTEDTTCNVIYHRIEWFVNPSAATINGKVTTMFKPVYGAVSDVTFSISDTLTVDSVVSASGQLSYTHADNSLNIVLGAPVVQGDIDSVSIYYHGKPYSTNYGTFTQHVNYYNDTSICTMSSVRGGKDWWPCKLSLTDKIDSLDIFITTSDIYTAVSNGVLVSENSDGGFKTAHWKHRKPVATFLVALAVGKYNVYTQNIDIGNGISVENPNYYFIREDSATACNYLTCIDKYMKYFSDIFIPYPFSDEKYGQLQTANANAAMENQTITFLNNLYDTTVMVHELAHHWFGNYITPSSWNDVWVKEGFATFCEHIAMEKFNPEYYREWKYYEVLWAHDLGQGGSVYVDDATSFQRILDLYYTYKKGGMILVMLKNQIGDEAFYSGINQMLTDNPYSSVSAQDVKRYLETAADTNLTTFFDIWYYGTAVPDYAVNVTEQSGSSVTFNISQTTSDQSVDFIPMNIDIRFKSATGDSITARFSHSANNQEFTYDAGFEVSEVIFDPKMDIIANHPVGVNYISSVSESNTVNVFVGPNPVVNICNVNFNSPVFVEEIVVLNIMGKVMFTQKIYQDITDSEIDFSALPSGQYVLMVRGEKGFTELVIKE